MSIIYAGVLKLDNIYSNDFTMEENIDENSDYESNLLLSINNISDNNNYTYEV